MAVTITYKCSVDMAAVAIEDQNPVNPLCFLLCKSIRNPFNPGQAEVVVCPSRG
jgi:hypothetical protein